MATKKTAAVTPTVIYNDLSASDTDTGVKAPEGAISADDPRLLLLWKKAAIKATKEGYCGYYDTIAKTLGAPTRAQLGIPGSSYQLRNMRPEPKDAEGNARKNTKVTFKGTVNFMNQDIDLTWTPTLYTSGTRDDINAMLEETYEDSPNNVIRKKLNEVRTREINKVIKNMQKPEAVLV